MDDSAPALRALAERIERALARENAGAVTLDQSSVGRLSRMDALQQQAMAQSSIQPIFRNW